MQVLDYITIVFFTICIICAGLLFTGSGKTMKSFFSAGGAVPWGMSGLSLFMGFFSAGTFVVWGSIAYSHGWVAVMIQWTMCIAGLLVGTIVAPRWRRTGVLTAAEYITERFGIKVQKTYTILFLFVSLFTTGSFLYPVGKILEISTGLPLSTCILLLGGISILYVAAGGLRAVVVTDVLQFLILFSAIIIVIPLALGETGGITGFVEAVPEGFFKLVSEEYTWGFMIAFCLYNAVFIGGNWAYVQRYTTVKTEKDARKVGWLFSFLYTFSPVLWMLPAMIYRIINPDLSGLGDEGAYLLMCKEVLPAGLLGLMLGGMLFATASSMNSTLNISAGVFTNDIYYKLFPKTEEKVLLRVARISTIVFGIFSIIVALLIPKMGGVVNVVITIGALTGVPLYLPVIWSLFSKRMTGKAVLSVTLISLAVNLFFKFVTPPLFGFALDRTEEMVLGVGFPVICLIVFELYAAIRKMDSGYLEYEKIMAKKEELKRSDSGQDNEKVKEENRFSGRVIGLGIMITGVTIAVLGFINDNGKAVVLSVAALQIILGSIIYFLNRKRKRQQV